MSLLKNTVASLVAVSALVGAPASAADTNWGIVGVPSVTLGFGFPFYGAFADTYSFTILSGAVASAAVAEISFGPDMSNGNLSLYQGDAADGFGDDTQIGSSHAFDGTASQSFGFGSLGAGTYYYRITGNDGSYAIASALSAVPVPEPASMALMLAGLGALGVMGRRRRQS